MTPRTFIGLAVLTAAVSVAAGVVVADRYGNVERVRVDEPAFPGLEDKLNDVSEVAIILSDGSLVMRRQGDQWVMSSRANHPVRAEKVNRMLVQMSQLRLYEPKTKLPERHARLEVEEPGQPNVKSKLLRLRRADGTLIAEAIFGKEEFFMAGPSRRGVYLRRTGDPQSWLATGFFELSKWARDWVVRDIMDIPSKRVHLVEAVTGDGSRLTVFRDSPGENPFQVRDLPAGSKLDERADGKMRDMGSALAVLDLNDVLPTAEKPITGDTASKATVRTFDGLVVEIALMQEGEDVWATFRAGIDESRLATTPASADLKPADEVRKEADAINARVGGWTYRIPDYKGLPLRTTIGDLLAPPGAEKAS